MSEDDISIAKSDLDQIRDYTLSTIVAHERLWTDAAAQHPENARFFDLLRRALESRRTDATSLAREAAGFLEQVATARYGEAIAELDAELARRERNFLLVLVAAIVENRRLAQLERARGRLGDIEWTLGVDRIRHNGSIIDRLAGDGGYLTEPPRFEFMRDWSSHVGNDLARAISNSLRSTRRSVWTRIAHFLPRYLLDAAWRNSARLVVVTVGFGWLINWIVALAHISTFTIIGLILFAVAKFGPIVYERMFKQRWLEAHRKAVRRATFRLYYTFADFLPDRAFLDAIQELSDEAVRRELWPKSPDKSPVPVE